VALVSPQQVTQAGIVPAYAAVSASDTFVPRPGLIYHVKNGGGSPDTVVLNSVVPSNYGTDVDLTVSVAAGAEKMIAIGTDAARFSDPVTGLCTVTHSFQTSVTAGLFSQ
jgi:hypothetical protein